MIGLPSGSTRTKLVPQACERLLTWAEERGLADGQWLGYMWEDPERVAEVALSGNLELEQRALDWIFGTWLPQSGFEPDEQPAFEAWAGRPYAHGLEHFELNCELPVKRA